MRVRKESASSGGLVKGASGAARFGSDRCVENHRCAHVRENTVGNDEPTAFSACTSAAPQPGPMATGRGTPILVVIPGQSSLSDGLFLEVPPQEIHGFALSIAKLDFRPLEEGGQAWGIAEQPRGIVLPGISVDLGEKGGDSGLAEKGESMGECAQLVANGSGEVGEGMEAETPGRIDEKEEEDEEVDSDGAAAFALDAKPLAEGLKEVRSLQEEEMSDGLGERVGYPGAGRQGSGGQDGLWHT